MKPWRNRKKNVSHKVTKRKQRTQRNSSSRLSAPLCLCEKLEKLLFFFRLATRHLQAFWLRQPAALDNVWPKCSWTALTATMRRRGRRDRCTCAGELTSVGLKRG